MTGYDVLNQLNNIPEQFVEEAEKDALPKRISIWKIGVAVAACLCVLTGAFFSIQALKKNEPTLITAQNSIGDYLSTSLERAPYPGEVWFAHFLSSDIAKRGEASDDVVYWVEITFSNEEIFGNANMYKDLTAAECKRLAALGYELYIHEFDWTGYWGEPKHFSTVCGKLSVAQMEALTELSQYGCYLDFGMKSPDECVRVQP